MTPSTAFRSNDGDRFEYVEADEIGYEPSHVDAFLDRARRAEAGEAVLTVEDVRQARFATVQGGYAPDQVDDELDRLEASLAEAEQDAAGEPRPGSGSGSTAAATAVIPAAAATDRREAGADVVEEPASAAGLTDEDAAALTGELLARADRAPAERFRRPSREDAEGYDVDEVDALVDRIRATLAEEAPADAAETSELPAPVSVDDVRRAAFAGVAGQEGYDEAQVDAYLDAVVDVLLRRR